MFRSGMTDFDQLITSDAGGGEWFQVFIEQAAGQAVVGDQLPKSFGSHPTTIDKPSGSAGKAKAMPQDDDYQLAQALSLLKGLSITSGR